MTFLGHSTVRIEIAGSTVLTDPIVRGHVGPLLWIGDLAHPSLFSVEIVLISHAHHDHLDLPSLEALADDPAIVVPRGLRPLLERRGLRNVYEMSSGEVISLPGVTITATRAVHSGKRLPFGPTCEPLGFVVSDGTLRVYFAGDTDLFDEMALLRPIDAALLPVWGWGPKLGAGHMDPARAARAVQLIRPAVAIPVHWGSLWPAGFRHIRPGRLADPPYEFRDAVERNTPGARVEILRPGERLVLAHGQAAVTGSTLDT